MQKVLNVMTKGNTLRSKFDCWSAEDADLVQGMRCWKVLGMKVPDYETILHALADGWRLLAPPVEITNFIVEGEYITGYYDWWLVKD